MKLLIVDDEELTRTGVISSIDWKALSGAMGNQMYVATFGTEEEMNTFYKDVLAEK